MATVTMVLVMKEAVLVDAGITMQEIGTDENGFGLNMQR